MYKYLSIDDQEQSLKKEKNKNHYDIISIRHQSNIDEKKNDNKSKKKKKSIDLKVI
jgi:hypothetical protein